jgi:alkanesulfonate monooxygenase SsuD/methylene tetrahydromethanopterin reductase-like flavin-dependent oxidoreductase (luciferase family)
VRYGLELAAAGTCDARTLGDLAALAEDSGWDGVFLEDYLVHWSAPDAPTYDPWVALAAIAIATRRVRIGTAMTALSRRRPWKVARETVTLEHLSNGRLILGAGLGDRKDGGFARVSEEVAERVRAARLDEALEILVGLWSGEPFSFEGEHFQVRDATFLPRPVRALASHARRRPRAARVRRASPARPVGPLRRRADGRRLRRRRRATRRDHGARRGRCDVVGRIRAAR